MKQNFFQKISSLIILLTLMLSLNFQACAQLELKLNPPAALFGFFQIGAEYIVSNDFGLEAEVLFSGINNNSGGGALLHGKYYFNPDFGSDKFYIGLLAGGFGGEIKPLAAFGFEAGYKLLGEKNILFEIGVSLGRVTTDRVIPWGRLMFGYRFPARK